MRLLGTNSSNTTLCLQAQAYPKTLKEGSLPGVDFASRTPALTQKEKNQERTLPFVTTYLTPQCKISNKNKQTNKQTVMKNWNVHVTQNQPLLNTIYRNHPIIFIIGELLWA